MKCKFQRSKRKDKTCRGSASRTIVLADCKPLVHAALVEGMFTAEESQFVFRVVIIQADQALWKSSVSM